MLPESNTNASDKNLLQCFNAESSSGFAARADCSWTSLPFSSTHSEQGNSPGDPGSLQERPVPKHHRGKVHEAARQGGLWAQWVSICVCLCQGRDGAHRGPETALGGSSDTAAPGESKTLHWGRHRFGSKPPRQVAC